MRSVTANQRWPHAALERRPPNAVYFSSHSCSAAAAPRGLPLIDMA